MKLLLFDIDGTLLHSGGAGTRAADRAFEKVYGITGVMEGLSLAGKTDPLILGEMFDKALGRGFTPDEAQQIYKEYLVYLRKEVESSDDFEIMPGIPELLELLSVAEETILGVATGNIEEGAMLKLRRVGLDSYFKFGGFGSDAEIRKDLIRTAIERGRRLVNVGKEFRRIFVIGDTPFDIIHGRAAGAKTVAVATGSYSLRELESHNPDYLFRDFGDLESVLEIF